MELWQQPMRKCIPDQIAPDDEMKEYIQESCTDLNGVIDYLKRCK